MPKDLTQTLPIGSVYQFWLSDNQQWVLAVLHYENGEFVVDSTTGYDTAAELCAALRQLPPCEAL